MCQYLELVEMGQLTKRHRRAVAVANWLQFNKVNFEFSLNFAIFGKFSLRLDLLFVLSIATYLLIFFYFYYYDDHFYANFMVLASTSVFLCLLPFGFKTGQQPFEAVFQAVPRRGTGGLYIPTAMADFVEA